ncbi:MAG: DUF1232 domain-containing protein [Spirochaetes bacterium]|jgi:uncharacterized membrane protein YkvA (DUF1232 family)|nr:DUF1232 domain-containing protein [Spirochaetota bacterium]MBP8991978.1 DUF1232 domain-containing protein [Spirochaetota bacterium]HOV46671.1 YkvA family protein [Exilispira sp.]HPB48443.1 YkvA family protein [Exilispira sp.]HQM89873.1 YkvA family protein [Exilispira sp.]
MKIRKTVLSLKIRAKNLKNDIIAIYFAYKDPITPLLPKLVILLTLGYALSPIDLIPDFIPVLGYLDDLLILPALITLSIRLIPASIMKNARARAKTEPINLHKNWFFAIIFIILWLMIIYFIVSAVIKLVTALS